MLRSGNIPSLIQGVSQQPASLRLPTQLDLQENCYSSTVEGLIRRPPTEHVSKVSDIGLETAFMHVINRDVSERYNAIVHKKDVQVFTVAGVEKAVVGDQIDSTTLLLDNAASVINGATFQIAADPGETLIDFVVSGITTATVKLQGSVDGAAWSDLDTRTTDGTTVGVAIGTNVFIRGIVSAWTAGTIDLSATYRRNPYLISTNPKTDYRAVTVADFTFIVNSTITPAMKANVTPTRNAEGLVFVKAGNHFAGYHVYIDSTLRATYTTSATDVTTLGTDNISTELYNDLVAAGLTSFTFTKVGSVIHITKDPSVDSTLLLLDNAASVINGSAFTIDATPGETTVDFVVAGITTATVKLQGSVNGTSWSDLDTRTTNGTTAGIAIGSNLYLRGIVSAWTSGVIDLSATYKRTSFVLQVLDSNGGNNLKAFKDVTNKFTDLPTVAPNGFVIKIDANADTLAGAYYLEAVCNQASQSFGEATWQECPAPGVSYILDPKTMPHALIRQVDGTFEFNEIEWTNRIVGDEDSNGLPSFIGEPINDVVFYKNRLGFLADEFYVFSETGEYFNFFRTTVTQILDTDPIDSRAVHQKVSVLKHAVVFNTDLILFSDQTQFKIPGDVAFTPKTFRCDAVAEFEGNMITKPVNAGKSLYFVFNREGFAGLKDLHQTESISNVMDAEDLTAHAPAYIPAGVFRMTISTLEGITCVLTDGKPSSIYVYKTAFNPLNGQKVQSAWFEWPMGTAGEVKVLDAGFIESTLYLLVQRLGKVYQEKILLQPSRVDAGSTYVTCLDRRITQAGLTVTYSAGPNTTQIDGLPYPPVAGVFTLANTTGIAPAVTVIDSDSISVPGNFSAMNLWLGERYNSRFRPSTIFIRKQSATGGTVIDEVSRLQLKRGYLNYNNSGYFQVNVTPEGRDTSSYIFTGRLVGVDELGEVALGSGRFSFGILSKNDRVILEISSNKILPFRLTSMEWEGEYTKRSQG